MRIRPSLQTVGLSFLLASCRPQPGEPPPQSDSSGTTVGETLESTSSVDSTSDDVTSSTGTTPTGSTSNGSTSTTGGDCEPGVYGGSRFGEACYG